MRVAYEEFRERLPVQDPRELRYTDQVWEFLLRNYADEITEIGDALPGHTLSVAQVVLDEIGLGSHSINAALLHETLEIQGFEWSSLQKLCSTDSMNILRGLKKIKSIRTDRTRYQSENFIKLLLAVSEDIRSTLIQLADRLHHLRHYERLVPASRLQLAQESAFLYAPVAHRLGLYKIKTELEDLSMKILDPEAFALVKQKISDSAERQSAYIRDFVAPVRKVLEENGFRFDVKWRTKSISSIWGKMKKQGVDFEQVYDVFAIRIILDDIQESEKADCWKVYSLVTDIYPPNPERLRDWISVPKASGYESLHTTVLGPGKRWVEVQVRTRRMDEIAEKGHAAHWQYKDSTADITTAQWLTSIRELLENPEPDVFQEANVAKADFYSDKIFVFTPTGDLRKLSQGATVLDFAFDIHTRIGSECTGARVNGKNVTIKHKLENGDHVEIQTSKNQNPKPDWLGFVVSSKAKSRIRRALKEARHQEAAEGKETLERKFRNWKLPFTDESIASLIRKFGFSDSVELYAAVAREKLNLREVKDYLTLPEKFEKSDQQPGIDKPLTDKGERTKDMVSGEVLEIDRDLDRVNFRLASCCNPIFGDDIFGFVTVSKGITIHRVNCPNATDLTERYPYRIIKARWKKSDNETSYVTSIRLSGEDKLGIVNALSEVISNDMKVNMRSLTFDTQDGRFEGLISVNIYDIQHLEALIKKLLKIDGINKAVREE